MQEYLLEETICTYFWIYHYFYLLKSFFKMDIRVYIVFDIECCYRPNHSKVLILNFLFCVFIFIFFFFGQDM